ncbi:chemotaxis protein CheA [Alkaliphilus sp. MSJ-5]|uniref:Chemotaxis protein CheA n=1 Tax=Alkaliphilus flagellatus TaxID=2841507 RepID=A0ABS6G4M0_9FIRM|nr:chemotaxis protein CheA [Alkaliphilus flagellatus]MBU5677438.1 chemotaxis protein CheA [Alkaliphilus flagellatus]
MDINQYLEIFIEESKEHLQNMNSNLLYLENHPEDTNTLNEIFRVAHTLKGMSATMGFNNIAHLTHEMENVLDYIRRGNMKVNTEITDLLFECFDRLEGYINNVEANSEEGNDSALELIDKLQISKLVDINANDKDQDEKKIKLNANKTIKSTIEFNEYLSNVVSTAIKDGLNVNLIKITLDGNCMLKSARAYIIISTLEKFSDIVQSNPSIEEIEDEKFDLSFELVLITKHNEEFIRKELSSISEVESIEISPVLSENIDISQKNDVVNNTDKIQVVEENKQQENEEAKNKKSKTSKTVRVDIDRLDNLMNLVSELIIIKTRLEDAGDERGRQNTSEAIEYLERITTNLHDAVMKVRMVPIERVFNRFPRMVRDLSKDLGKDITLILSGEETEVDRTVIDEIGDPLIHLIRNSIDHGIEEIDKRLELGKQRTGTVKLSAYPDGNSVVIEVEDDGSGINIEKVKNKAIERGIITTQDTQLMDNKELIQLLFSPGFSTADKISDISGRGVGLDVVKTKIESLGGIVEADTTLGKGTKFIIRLPLTLAIIQALLVVVGSEKYAIPLNSIKEITTIEKSSIRRVQKNEVVLYRDSTLPILRLSELLNVPNTNSDIDSDNFDEDVIVVIVKKGDKDAGLIVDKLIGQQEIVIKSLGKYLSTIRSIAGATILGNGSVALIVDTNSFF